MFGINVLTNHLRGSVERLIPKPLSDNTDLLRWMAILEWVGTVAIFGLISVVVYSLFVH